MPFCHRHPDTRIITDYLGVSTCARCEAEERAARERRCRACQAPVDEPGLCPACRRVAVRARVFSWITDHPVIVVVAILLFGLWLVGPTLCRATLAAYVVGGGEEPKVLRIWTRMCGG